jgi:hypothetical protein
MDNLNGDFDFTGLRNLLLSTLKALCPLLGLNVPRFHQERREPREEQ